ncbi:MAG: M23 family metallopeptidase [Actinomycetota bacterium]
MAGGPGTLRARRRLLACLALASLAPGPRALSSPPATPPIRWYAPALLEGKAFPVLRSGEQWLNWRDTFGAPRMRLQPDGIWRQVGIHQGIDIFSEKGAPVISMTPGEVENAGWTFYSGWRVGIRDAGGDYYLYAHLSGPPAVSKGQAVKAGSVIGSLGSSGYGAEGTADEFPPHLHFGVKNASGWENPQGLLERLYENYVQATRGARERIADLRRRERLLVARAHGTAAPPERTLGRAMDALSAQRAQLEVELFFELDR